MTAKTRFPFYGPNLFFGQCIDLFCCITQCISIYFSLSRKNNSNEFPGAGKSTLIKLIIDLSTDKTEKFETPIVGSVKDQDVPTSGDVHLYPDPNSITSRFPILYADCEGLEGGEREPISARFKKNTHKLTGVGRVSSFERKARKTQHTSERDITWADTPKKRSREFAVTHLYPRLLYTFSDVVVFVLKNPRYVLSACSGKAR